MKVAKLGYLDNTKYIKVVAGDIVNCGAVTFDIAYALGTYYKIALSFWVHVQTGNIIRPNKNVIIGPDGSLMPVFYLSESDNAVYIKLSINQAASVAISYNVCRAWSAFGISMVDALPNDATVF